MGIVTSLDFAWYEFLIIMFIMAIPIILLLIYPIKVIKDFYRYKKNTSISKDKIKKEITSLIIYVLILFGIWIYFNGF